MMFGEFVGVGGQVLSRRSAIGPQRLLNILAINGPDGDRDEYDHVELWSYEEFHRALVFFLPRSALGL